VITSRLGLDRESAGLPREKMVQVVCQGRTGVFARDSTDCPHAPARALLQFVDSLD